MQRYSLLQIAGEIAKFIMPDKGIEDIIITILIELAGTFADRFIGAWDNYRFQCREFIACFRWGIPPVDPNVVL